jgi:hypothetical protein
MNVTNPIEIILNDVLNSSEKEEAMVILQFKAPVQPVQGALKRHETLGDGFYELLAMMQVGQNKVIPMSHYFHSSEVACVMKIREDLMSKIAAPSNSGLVIPT